MNHVLDFYDTSARVFEINLTHNFKYNQNTKKGCPLDECIKNFKSIFWGITITSTELTLLSILLNRNKTQNKNYNFAALLQIIPNFKLGNS